MVRFPDDELNYRVTLRKKYLEDPNYRRWSDIVPGGISGSNYRNWRDDVLFMYLISGQTGHHPNVSDMVGYLDVGHELPINWNNFYAYFDERLNDPENRYLSYLKDTEIMGDAFEPKTSVEELLNRYRDRLLSTYDMI